MLTETSQEKTGLGNYFVANYPPFSAWNASFLPDAMRVLNEAPRPDTPLGLYLHIPFCRKRCKFCYFRVYTDKNARDVETYLDALVKEVELYSKLPVVGGRKVQFIYFGGGTPSYLSGSQLKGLFDRLQPLLPWDGAKEVTFECEPGTLQQHKLKDLKEMGVTRLSLGIENFSDAILESNGRAHLSEEIYRAYGWARDLEFPQINVDLIAGMVGETWDNWKDCVKKTIELSPDSVTIYQMELPYNTVYSREMKELPMADQSGGGSCQVVDGSGVADWPTKRAWVDYAFKEMGKAGFHVSSAYTVVKDPSRGNFEYRDSLWHGADMFGTGVASFGHVSGVHVQNVDGWDDYTGKLNAGELPLGRALPVRPKQRLLREMMLQLKTGKLEREYFQTKFQTDILNEFRGEFEQMSGAGYVKLNNGTISMTSEGLLQVDRLLPSFFEPEFRGIRYT